MDTRLYLSQPEQANVLIEYRQSSLIECGSRESLSGINQRRNLQKIVELDENLKKNCQLLMKPNNFFQFSNFNDSDDFKSIHFSSNRVSLKNFLRLFVF